MKAYKGETIIFEFIYTNERINSIDMTGYEFKLTGKLDINQPDKEFCIDDTSFDKSDITDGKVGLNLETSNLEPQYYMCQVSATKENSIIYTDIFAIEILQSIS